MGYAARAAKMAGVYGQPVESEDPEDLRLDDGPEDEGSALHSSSASSSSSSSSVLWQLKCLWIIAQALLFAFCVAAFIYATDGATGIAGEGVVAFAAIALLVFALFTSVAGSCILWKHQTQFHIGLLVGVLAILCNQLLVVAVMTGQDLSLQRERGEDPNESATNGGIVCVFAVILLLFYMAVTVDAWRSRHVIIARKAPARRSASTSSTGDQVISI